MKQLVRRALAGLGLEIRRAQPDKPFIPYIEHYSLAYKGSDRACEFDAWLATRHAELWYKEWLHAASNPTWELDEWSKIIEPGDRILEIGCHHGVLSLMLARLIGPTGRLYSMDANPENALITGAQFSLNNLGSYCTAAHLAGGDKAETLSMAWRTNSHVSAPGDTEASYRVQAVTGDGLDQLHGPFNALKIDVEGFEVFVLRGCANILKRKPKLLLEVHPEEMRRYSVTLDDLWSILRANNYQGTVVTRPNFDRPVLFTERSVSLSEVSNLHLR